MKIKRNNSIFFKGNTRKKRPGWIIATLGVALLTAGPALPARAQRVRRLSLEEAVELGLQNSEQVKIARSKARQASAALREARESRLPDLDLSGNYRRLGSSANMRLKFDQENDEDGAGQDVPEPGGDPQTDGAPREQPGYLLLGQASLSVPLFSGFRLNHAVRSAEYLQKAAGLDAEAGRTDVMLNIIEAWANLFKARAAVGLVEENLKQVRQRVKDFSNLEANGLLARNDLLKARLQQSDVELALLEAQNNLKVSNYNMDLLLGLPENTVLEVDSLLLPALPETVSAGSLGEQALDRRNDLAALGWKEEAAAEGIKVAAAERWPVIGLSAGYLAADLENVVTLTNAVNVGVGISFNLASLYKTGSKVAQAREQAAQLRLEQERLTDAVRMQVHQAFRTYELSLKKIEVYREAVAQADENFRITKNKHANSLATTTDLLDADVARLRARMDAAYARTDALLAWCRLLKASGQLEPGFLDSI